MKHPLFLGVDFTKYHMNDKIFELIKKQLSNDIIHLSEQFNVPIDETLELMVIVNNRTYFRREKKKYKELKVNPLMNVFLET